VSGGEQAEGGDERKGGRVDPRDGETEIARRPQRIHMNKITLGI